MSQSGFIVDGEDRLLAVLCQSIREEVEAEYKERVRGASCSNVGVYEW